jgi:lipopolysaccharide transport system permease protein
MYVAPVGFAWRKVVPDNWKFWFSLNPLVGVIDGYRWCIFGPDFEPYWTGFWISLGVIVLLLITGLVYFRSTEKTFADIV